MGVYAIENFVVINPKLRAAHRYHTCAAHKDWRQYADLPGPDIRILRLYTAYNIDSITVIINAELYTNWYITEIIGHLDRTTIWTINYIFNVRLFHLFKFFHSNSARRFKTRQLIQDLRPIDLKFYAET